MKTARGKCGSAPLQSSAPKARSDERGVYVEVKSIVRSAAADVALMRVRRCPHALAMSAASVMRVARRVHSKLRTFGEEAPNASAAFVDCVEVATRQIDHIHAVEWKEANPS